MCDLNERVVVVPREQLDADWVACCSATGEQVVFVRSGSEQLLDNYCAAGHATCPIWQALVAQVAVA